MSDKSLWKIFHWGLCDRVACRRHIAPSSPTPSTRLNHFQFSRFRFSRRRESSSGLGQSFLSLHDHFLETSRCLLCQGNLNLPGVNVGFKHGALGLVSDKAIPVRLYVSRPLVVAKLEVLGTLGRKVRSPLLVCFRHDAKERVLQRKPPVVSFSVSGVALSVINCRFWF